MPQIFQGAIDGAGLRIAVIASRYNDEFSSKLLEGALDCLGRHGVDDEAVEVFRVPGAFEIPLMAARVAALARFDAIVTLGVLLRGDTPHFDFISSQVTSGISRVAVDAMLPVAFGVLTCDTSEQAAQRVTKGSHKGWEAALAALEMANLFRRIGQAPVPQV